MRKFVCAAIVTVCTVGFAMAEDIQVIISKIGDDGTITYKKTEKGKATGDDLTAKLAKDAGIFKGKGTFNKEDKSFKVEKVGDKLEKAAISEMMTKAASPFPQRPFRGGAWPPGRH